MKFALTLLLATLSLVYTKFNYNKIAKELQEYPEPEDGNTYSNYKDVKQQHYHIDWDLDLEEQTVIGTVKLDMIAVNDLREINLDMWDQKIKQVEYQDKKIKSKPLNFKINEFPVEEEGLQGQQLSIDTTNVNGSLRSVIKKGHHFSLLISYSFDKTASAMSFLTKEQTSGKEEPYVYSQCEAIYARSLVPLQDTPINKLTYSAEVIAHKNVDVYMSANKTKTEIVDREHKKHYFENSNPIPSYLTAIIAGKVVKKQVGDVSYVIAEPDIIQKCVSDLENLQSYLDTVENYVKIPYAWGTYTIVIMPPSFPFGGMENPLLTFASPSIITGDKSGTSVAIHEIAHSWTGNMVTCANWSNMWLNEGFTVFMERKAQIKQYGHDYMVMDSIVGNHSLTENFQEFGFHSNYSSLYPLTIHTNPDDSFSEVPYEKGYQFLTFIQTVIGEDLTRDFISQWVDENTWEARTESDLEEFFKDFVLKNTVDPQSVFAQIDWKTWVHEPGYPPAKDLQKIEFHTKLETESVDLANAFLESKGEKRPENWEILKHFNNNQIYVFLGIFQQNQDQLSPKLLGLLQDCYGFSQNGNMEITYRWFQITILGKYEAAKPDVYKFLGSIGRQKMIVPQYKAYVQMGQKEYARTVFEHYKNFYHPIAVMSIQAVLA